MTQKADRNTYDIEQQQPPSFSLAAETVSIPFGGFDDTAAGEA